MSGPMAIDTTNQQSETKAHMFKRFCLLILALLLPAALQAQALPDLSLEDLMRIDSGRVFGASERTQPVTEAPSSVSFITAEEIARYGYRTLADILRGVRGLYVSDDRNFSLLGARGFAKPGDYNSRILLLVNGHRVNDNVFGQAEIGAEFGIDTAMFQRVEIIRGPASSLYGDSAFFAVINVITKQGSSLKGQSLALDAGTLGTYMARASAGRQLANGLELAASGTLEQSAGVKRLYFPAFDSPATNHGIAQGLDGEAVGQLYGQVIFKNLTFTGAYGRRRRDVPTASFQSLFNRQDDREQSTDRHTLGDAEYVRPIGRARFTLRASFDRFTSDGIYPRANSDPDGPDLIAKSSVLGTRWTVASKITRPLPGNQLLTAGVEYIDNVHQDQEAGYVNTGELVYKLNTSSTQHAVYLQDEIKLTPWLIANGGLRYDAYERFSRVTPRAALIAMPSSNQSFKYLYGRAFRAPNAWELNPFTFGDGVLNLRPESIDTHELVWERYSHDWLRTSVSTYWYKVDGLVTVIPDDSAVLGTTFVNEGHVRANGLELEAQMRLSGGLQGLMSYALQRAKNLETGEVLVNSPRQLAKARMSLGGDADEAVASLEVLYIGSRRTIADQTLGQAVTANLTVIAPVRHSLEFVATFRNLFNANYADPVSDAHRQDTITQNGRTVRIGFRWKM
jgi:outer membrane receptor for ferrienterochelin and colicins